MSLGKESSEVYPSVAKLVVSTNYDIKKLVNIFLTHYAEFEQDAALLAISTYKKDLDNPNQIVRANALKTLSSIRVNLISPLVGLAIKKAVTDISPFVRKTAAYCAAKLVSLDPTQKEGAIEAIESLLGDSTTIVLSAAISVFNEICPENWDLIHPHYRKICTILPDLDEWGQTQAIHMFIRYARVHFPNPEVAKKSKRNNVSDSDDSDEDLFNTNPIATTSSMDPDLQLLIRAAMPLLRCKNASVVLAVASMLHYLTPGDENGKIAKALLRLLRGRPETKFVVLSAIMDIVQTSPEMFSPYVTDFFVSATDPFFVKKFKINIISLLANESNISKILREFKFYASQEDDEFVKVTIQAVGRCASTVPSVTETCMHCLTSLIGSPIEPVVAEAIVVIKQLLQISSGSKINYDDIVKHVAKLLDKVSHPPARASIIWIVGEYVKKLKRIAPDVLRKLAKSFVEEDKIVKLQILNLGCKLYLTIPEQTTKLFQYILNLSRYDVDYDIRDRCRVIRRIILNPNEQSPVLSSHATQLLITSKPVPIMGSLSNEDSDGDPFYIGSLSSLLGRTIDGYIKLSPWASEVQCAELRNVVKKDYQPTFGSISSQNMSSRMPSMGYKKEIDETGYPSNPLGFGNVPSPIKAHNIAGFSSKEEYEKSFWGDDDDEENEENGSDSDTDSSDSSDSDTDTDTDTDSSDSDSDSD